MKERLAAPLSFRVGALAACRSSMLSSIPRQIIVVTDSLPVRSGGAAVRKAVRATLKAHTPTSVSFRILRHASRADVNLRVADYCAWAAYRRWEREDDRSYRIIADAGVVWAESRLVQAG
jgi:hypothetical protein